MFAALIRLELPTPRGRSRVSDETYNKLFTMHGVMMVFFFLIPSIPATLGNFLVPIMIGAKDLAFPQLNLLELVPLHPRRHFTLCALMRAASTPAGRSTRRSAPSRRTTNVIADGARHLHHRLLVDPHGPQLHRHDPPDARARHDVVPPAALHLVDVCDEPDHDPRHAGARDHAAARRGGAARSTSASSTRRSAATRCSSSISSGSTRIRPSTS